MIAITDLVFDAEDAKPGDNPTRVAAGTEVHEGDFAKEVWQHFVDNGAVGEAPGKPASVEQEEELDRLRAEVARLKKQQAAKESTEPPKSPKP
jgi:hypothetical protein